MKNQPARTKKLPSRNLRNSINDLTYQIRQLREKNVDYSEELSKKYNRMLIERAKLRQMCNRIPENVFTALLKKFNLKREPKSICDYFESN